MGSQHQICPANFDRDVTIQEFPVLAKRKKNIMLLFYIDSRKNLVRSLPELHKFKWKHV